MKKYVTFLTSVTILLLIICSYTTFTYSSSLLENLGIQSNENIQFTLDSNAINLMNLPQNTNLLNSISNNSSYYSDVPQTASYSEAVNRLSDFKIIKGDGNGLFRPNSNVTREQFATILVKSLGYEDLAEKSEDTSYFTDVENNRWSKNFINIGVRKGLFSGVGNNKFKPLQEVTYGQALTMIINSKNIEVIGENWPHNYIQLANEMNLSADLNFKHDDKLPRWAVAVLVDRILYNNIDKIINSEATLKNAAKDYLILENSTTNRNLHKNQILTDRGILTLSNDQHDIDLGAKVRITAYGDKILRIWEQVNGTEKLSVKSYFNNEVTYISSLHGSEEDFLLPQNIKYYHNGEQIEYESLNNIIKGGTTIIFGYSSSNFDYGVIVEPIYMRPIIITDSNLVSIASSLMRESKPINIFRKGEHISILDLNVGDVMYTVTDLQTNIYYIKVFNEKVEGKITNILPDKISPQLIEIEGTEYKLSSYFNINKINISENAFNVGDIVYATLDNNGSVLDINALEKRVTPEINLIIQANYYTNNNLGKGHVQTNQGIYNIEHYDVSLELGKEYRVVVDGAYIVNVVEELNSVKYYTVQRISGNKLTVREGDLVKQLTLPNGIQYFRNGSRVSYELIGNNIRRNSTIALASNDLEYGYSYGVLIDPIYSKPEVVSRSVNSTSTIGNITLAPSTIILRNNDIVHASRLSINDVIYNVSDYKNTTNYIKAYSNSVLGRVTAINPDRLSPQSIDINRNTYILSNHANVEVLTGENNSNPIRIDDRVRILLGRDEQVVRIIP